MFGKFLIAAALTTLATTSVASDWIARVEGPDIFGKTTVLALASSGRQNLVVQCDTETAPVVALTDRTATPIETTVPSVVFLLKAGGSDLIKAQATYAKWNEDYDGATVNEPAATTAMIVAISNATGEIQVGLDIFGNKVSASFTSRGSTNAMKQVTEHCPAPETEPTPES